MNTLKFALKTLLFAGTVTVLTAAPSFASMIKTCVGKGNDYPNLSITKDDTYVIRCQQAKDPETGKYVTIYAKSSADCARAGEAVNQAFDDGCGVAANSSDDPNGEATAGAQDPDEDKAGEEEPIDNPHEETAVDTAGPYETKKDEDFPIAGIIGIIAGVVVLIAIVVVIIVMSKRKGDKNGPTAPQGPTMPQAPTMPPTPGQKQ